MTIIVNSKVNLKEHFWESNRER